MSPWGRLPAKTAEIIARYEDLAEQIGDPRRAARAWIDSGFSDEEVARWLDARCFDPQAARELDELGVTPGQASRRTRDGRRDYRDTIAFKVSSGDLSPRQGAARADSSR